MPEPGFIIIHSNQLETLRELLVQWLSRHPVSVLGIDEILVQSNGIGQWLKIALAETDNNHPGIAAGLQVELPNQFVWQLYRAALGEAIPTSLPYDKQNLSWRILGMLPSLTSDVYRPLQRYLADDTDGRKSYQLALRLADLFDQYQVYRADWLQNWSAGADLLPNSKKQKVPADQLWQPALWRELQRQMAATDQQAAFSSRADVHNKALAVLQHGTLQRPDLLPERVIVFGVSSLPQQTVELLAALGKHRQVLLTVLNPSRYYWGDISTVKEQLSSKYKRQQRKTGMPAQLDPSELYLHAPPLLASLGKQGRDYITMLDQFDQPQQYQHWFNGRIDYFSDSADNISSLPLLQQLQQDVLELNALPQPKRVLSATDNSVSFHIAHSRQREVEILQDQLIADFAADPTLQPRDVIIMTPDISQYQAHINAVFGRIAAKDKRYLPYTLADQSLRGKAPVLIALEYLLQLPVQRFTLTEICDLLDVPAIMQCFGLNADALPQLRLWLSEAGVRWGLDEQQRHSLQLGHLQDAYSWLFGIERMLLGFAMGDSGSWHNRLPYAEVGGLAAAELGPLLQFIQQLRHWHKQLAACDSRSLAQWQQLLQGEHGLLASFFAFDEPQDQLIYGRLLDALTSLSDAAENAGFNGDITLNVLREAWLDGASQSGLSQRFLAGSLTFSTLMPMRAIPFRRIYLLGLNDGDYPRSRTPDDFDLMAGDYRAGDRSRRDDDRYLFLEALLSARDALYISWVGRNIRNNSELPPSVLVSQLRDTLDSGWQCQASAEHAVLPSQWLSREYPLQPFSQRYFTGEYQTYASEWEAVHSQPAEQNDQQHSETAGLNRQTSGRPGPTGDGQNNEQPSIELPPLTIRLLDDFLANPSRHYIRQRFKARFYAPQLVALDDEPFVLDTLQQFTLKQQLLQQLLREPDTQLDAAIAMLAQQAQLPLALFGEQTAAQLSREVQVVFNRYKADGVQWQRSSKAEPVALQLGNVALNDELTDLYQVDSSQAFILLRPTAIMDKQQLRWHTLRNTWLQQLVANSQGIAAQSLQYGLDEKVRLPARPQQPALAQLTKLASYWQQGLHQPLPVLPKTALVWLRTGDEGKARTCFEGGYQIAGELAQAAEISRYYPDFASLWQAGFADWAERLYGPLLDTPAIVNGETLAGRKN